MNGKQRSRLLVLLCSFVLGLNSLQPVHLFSQSLPLQIKIDAIVPDVPEFSMGRGIPAGCHFLVTAAPSPEGDEDQRTIRFSALCNIRKLPSGRTITFRFCQNHTFDPNRSAMSPPYPIGREFQDVFPRLDAGEYELNYVVLGASDKHSLATDVRRHLLKINANPAGEPGFENLIRNISSQGNEAMRLQLVNEACRVFDLDDTRLRNLSATGLLYDLDLQHANITNKGVASLATQIKLKSLNLSDTGVTDDGLTALANLSNLEILKLDGCAVGDRGLTQLAEIKSLKYVSIIETKISRAGATWFLKARPDVKLLVLPFENGFAKFKPAYLE